jgi:hypothetical protein
MLARNESYKHVTSLIADGNLIEDLQVLEGSEFLNNFHYLSLQGNKINKVYKISEPFCPSENLICIFRSKKLDSVFHEQNYTRIERN